MDIDNKILKYVEGTLKGQDKKDFEVLINSDAELKLKVEALSDLYNNSVPESPPYQLRQKIYNMIGINDESFMDIIIKKTSNILNILTGEDYLINIQPAFVTRSNEKSLLFSTKSITNFSSTFFPFNFILSLKSFKCGEVYNPTL